MRDDVAVFEELAVAEFEGVAVCEAVMLAVSVDVGDGGVSVTLML